MKEQEKILVPLDGSVLSEAVLPSVERLATAFGAGICLMQVVPTTIFPVTMEGYAQCGELIAACTKDGEEYLRKMEKRLKAKGFQVESLLLNGDEAQRILEQADRKDVSLIAMTTHGRSGVSRWMMGSVAEKVVRHATKPIFLVRSVQ